MIVYFIQRPADGAIKIGAASTGAPGRKINLRGRVPNGKLLTTTQGYLFVERWFHRRHANGRIEREYFEPSRELLTDVAQIRAHRRVHDQPMEPTVRSWSPELWSYMRKSVFGVTVEQMAALLCIKPVTLAHAEVSGSSRSLAAGLDVVAQALAHPFRWASHVVVPPIPKGGWQVMPIVQGHSRRPRLHNRDRYRAHVVRNVGDGART